MATKTYAHVLRVSDEPLKGTVNQPLLTVPDTLKLGVDILHEADVPDWIDVTTTSPQPGAGWTTADGGKTFAAPVAPAVDLRAYAAAARYARETAGITVGTAQIATDRDSQGMITGMWAAAQINPQIQVNFKSGSGFVVIGAAQVARIAAAVASYVQACFTAEAGVVAGVAAGTVKTTADVDAAFAAVSATFPGTTAAAS